jgi:predicted dehydrogenase
MSNSGVPLSTALSQSRVAGANNRIRLGGIGLGGRCRYLLNIARQLPETQIVALCDVYEPRLAEAREKVAPEARQYHDYRRLLESSDIDGVIIGSPDHWHVPMVMDAVGAGKDVYVEKPLTRTIEEGPLVENAVQESGRIVQVGYQQRSWDHFVIAQGLVEAGRLGKISLVLSYWYQAYYRRDRRREFEGKIDWTSWLGPARRQPESALRYFHWRWFWDFGGGHLTDLYSHWGDVIHWYMGRDSFESVQAAGGGHAIPEFECPDTINASWNYGDYTVVYNGSLIGSLDGGGIVFRGSEAMMKIDRSGFAIYPEGVIPAEGTQYPEPALKMGSPRDGTWDHMQNFLNCMRARRPPNCPVKPAVAIARAAHLANKAWREASGFRA